MGQSARSGVANGRWPRKLTRWSRPTWRSWPPSGWGARLRATAWRSSLPGPDPGSDSLVQLTVTGRDGEGGRPISRHRPDMRAATRGSPALIADGLIHPIGDGRRTHHGAGGRPRARSVARRGRRLRQRAGRSISPTRSCRSSPSSAATPGAATARPAARTGSGSACWGSSRRSTTRRLVTEGRGRRVFPAAPGREPAAAASRPRRSPTAAAGSRDRLARVPHDRPLDRPGDAVRHRRASRPSSGSRSSPAQRIMPRRGRQQLRGRGRITATARPSDVTRLAQYQSNAADVADGRRRGAWSQALDGVGEAAVMARFGGQVAVFRATSRSGRTIADLGAPAVAQPRSTRSSSASSASSGMPPARALHRRRVRPPRRRSTSAACCPTPDGGRRASRPTPTRRSGRSWSTACSTAPSTPTYFAMKWSAILRNKRALGDVVAAGDVRVPRLDPRGAGREHALRPVRRRDPDRQRRRRDEPAGRLVPPGQARLEEQVDDTAQLFLGMRLQCAQCHHHPFEKWSQDDYYGFAAFFSRVGRKPGRDPVTPADLRPAARAWPPTRRRARRTRPRRSAAPSSPTSARRDDPRQALADWMRRPDNPFFARALVNRYWKHFFGRGLVEPEDDMRVTNPPSEPRAARRPGRRLRRAAATT